MIKRLYLLCPTDCLEPVINSTFKQENYFYFSLGNSFIVENNTIESIKKIVKDHHIQEISFVLSNKNHIVIDALGTQDFLNMRGLRSLYNQLIKQKKHSEIFWDTDRNQFSILSYYLNSKIKELKFELGNFINSTLKINAKIYDRYDQVFKSILPDIVCMNKHYLN